MKVVYLCEILTFRLYPNLSGKNGFQPALNGPVESQHITLETSLNTLMDSSYLSCLSSYLCCLSYFGLVWFGLVGIGLILMTR